MAEIQEYLPEVSSPEPVGGVSPNIELAGAVGRSIENIGQNLEEVGAGFHRRNVQRESADVYAFTATQRAQSSSDLHDAINGNGFNQEKYFEDFNDYYIIARANFINGLL